MNDPLLQIMIFFEFQTKLVSVTPSVRELSNRILAVTFSETTEDLILNSVAGFICVTDINVKEQKLTVLSPQPKPLPKTLLLLSEVQFVDSSWFDLLRCRNLNFFQRPTSTLFGLLVFELFLPFSAKFVWWNLQNTDSFILFQDNLIGFSTWDVFCSTFVLIQLFPVNKHK